MPPRKIRLTPEERTMRAAARMIPGTLAGRAESASPVRRRELGRGEIPIPPGSSGQRMFFFAGAINVGTNQQMAWVPFGSTFHPNDTLFDLTVPSDPRVLVSGVYAVNVTVINRTFGAGKRMRGELHVDWDFDNLDAYEEITLENNLPNDIRFSISATWYVRADSNITFIIKHNLSTDANLDWIGHVIRLS